MERNNSVKIGSIVEAIENLPTHFTAEELDIGKRKFLVYTYTKPVLLIRNSMKTGSIVEATYNDVSYLLHFPVDP